MNGANGGIGFGGVWGLPFDGARRGITFADSAPEISGETGCHQAPSRVSAPREAWPVRAFPPEALERARRRGLYESRRTSAADRYPGLEHRARCLQELIQRRSSERKFRLSHTPLSNDRGQLSSRTRRCVLQVLNAGPARLSLRMRPGVRLQRQLSDARVSSALVSNQAKADLGGMWRFNCD